MNKQDMIRSLKVRIKYNEKEFAESERLHGEAVAAHPVALWHTAHSEMRDWHDGKVQAYKHALQMLEELEA